MFENIGGKIKMLASVICWTGIAVSLIVGVVFIVIAPLAGIAIIILGPLLSWISSFFTYGFGQLIENSDKLVANAEKDQSDNMFKDCKQNSYDSNLYARTAYMKDVYSKSSANGAEIVKKPEKSVNEVFPKTPTQTKDFLAEIKGTSTSDLEIILRDQKELYSKNELSVIEAELSARKNGTGIK